jgi:Fe-S cluster biogenesis protein NfuA
MTDHNHEIASEETRLRALLDNVSAYIEQYHGGQIDFVAYDGKVLQVRMGGACQGCRLTETTLRGWVEGTVRQFFPDIERIENV